MSEEVKPNPQEAPTEDAKLVAENIASGEEKAPTVDLEKDYEAAQKYSVSNGDRTDKGIQGPEAANQS